MSTSTQPPQSEYPSSTQFRDLPSEVQQRFRDINSLMHTASTDASHVSVSLNEIEGSVQQLTTSTHDVRSALSLVSFSQQSLSADVSVHIRRHRELAEAVSAVREASTAHSAALPLPDALEPLAEDFTRRQKDLVTRTAALKSSLDPTAFDAPPPRAN
eukprot:gnl/Ergobibamus_cyprinoides/4046.p1 GENE.gnl/Ergobibamus_cyprinoides/4046~~gnl/Ergobibamus_cyprinoides/4046.p1  ORF type:complete len:158 (+),score=19.00 gnl/Ergobibamus_cyprinoides/4046:402-875(+)